MSLTMQNLFYNGVETELKRRGIEKCSGGYVREMNPIIKDIRVYRSENENIDGNSLPSGFCEKIVDINLTRLVMKLREISFSLGEFHHLYINFTTCIEEGKIIKSERIIDKNIRYYDVGIDSIMYSKLGTVGELETLFILIEKVFIHSFITDEFTKEKLNLFIKEILDKGENVECLYKEKQNRYTAQIFLRKLDSGYFLPRLQVVDENKNILLNVELPEVFDVTFIGTIQLSNSTVKIKPKSNSFSDYYKEYKYPMEFNLRS